jgi:hypothetical protein
MSIGKIVQSNTHLPVKIKVHKPKEKDIQEFMTKEKISPYEDGDIYKNILNNSYYARDIQRHFEFFCGDYFIVFRSDKKEKIDGGVVLIKPKKREGFDSWNIKLDDIFDLEIVMPVNKADLSSRMIMRETLVTWMNHGKEERGHIAFTSFGFWKFQDKYFLGGARYDFKKGLYHVANAQSYELWQQRSDSLKKGMQTGE